MSLIQVKASLLEDLQDLIETLMMYHPPFSDWPGTISSYNVLCAIVEENREDDVDATDT